MAYKSIEDHRAYHRQYQREYRALRRAFNLCTECGRQDARTMAGNAKCWDCVEKRRVREGRDVDLIGPMGRTPKRSGEDKSLWPQQGRCRLCGAPVKAGETKWRGPHQYCEKHYQSTVQAGNKGRMAYLEQHGMTWGQTEWNRRRS